jgi:hypothetical protein
MFIDLLHTFFYFVVMLRLSALNSENFKCRYVYTRLNLIKKLGLMKVLTTLRERERESRDSIVGIATGYGPEYRVVGFRVPVGSRIFSLQSPDRLWGPPNLPSNGYRELFPRG